MNGNIKLQNNQLVVVQDNGQTTPVTIQRPGRGSRRSTSGGGSVAKGGQLFSTSIIILGPGNDVSWDGVQGANGITNPNPTELKVTTPGKYSLSFVVQTFGVQV